MTFKGTIHVSAIGAVHTEIENINQNKFEYGYIIEPLAVNRYYVNESIVLDLDGYEFEVLEDASILFYNDKLILEIDPESGLEETIGELLKEHFTNYKG
jgi:hypothetical protein